MEEEKTEPTLKEVLRRLTENHEKLIAEKKVKKFKIPFSGRLSKSKLKKGYSTICYVNENDEVSFFKAQILEGVYEDKKGIPHIGTPEHILNHKGKPFIIQTAHDVLPFNPRKAYDSAAKANSLATGWRLLANYIETTTIKPKGSFGVGAWVIGILILIGIGFYFFKSKGIA